MKKSTKYIGIALLLCFVVIGIIGANQSKHSQTTIIENKTTTDLSFKIIGVDNEVILDTTLPYQEGTVYDILDLVCKEHNIDYTTKGTGLMVYISSIDHLAEFDYGGSSGWTYTVNGEYPQKGCGAIDVEEGDSIEWIYFYE